MNLEILGFNNEDLNFLKEIEIEEIREAKIRTDEDYIPEEEYEDIFDAKYKIVEHFQGYDVIEYGNWMNDDRQGLEDIYKNSKQKVIWLN